MALCGRGGYSLAFFVLILTENCAGKAQDTIGTRETFGRVQVAAENLHDAIAEGKAAQRAARTVLGIHNARFDIVEAATTRARWGDVSRDGVPAYPWTFSNTARSTVGGPPNYVLRHEIGHDLFVRYLVPRTDEDEYGGDAPDWLDEMAAVAFEGCAQVEARRAEARRFADTGTLIPLKRFLRMPHPELAAKRPFGLPGQVMTVTSPTSDETPQFYAMARAFYDFLVVRTQSPAVIADLARAFRNGVPLEEWIVDKAGTGKSGDTLENVNRDFVAWIGGAGRYRSVGIADRNHARADGPASCR